MLLDKKHCQSIGESMKNLILSSMFMALLPIAANASDVTSATSLKLNSPDGLTNVQNLTVKLSSYCKYKSGIFWPESKTCGSKTIDLKVGANGVIDIPAVEKFSGLHASKTDNYEVSLSVYDGKEYLAIISARGKERLKRFKFENRPLSLYRLNAANINVSHDGADFFGSELSKVDRAMLLVSVKDKAEKNDYDDVLVVSSLHSLWARENLASYEGKKLLKDATQIDLEKLNFAKFNGTANETIVLNAYYTVTTDYSKKSDLRGTVELSLKPSALEEVGSLELKK